MVIDTSALVAALEGEPEGQSFVEAIAAAPRVLLSAASLVEASLVLESRRGEAAGRELDLFLHRARVQVIPVDADQAELARRAWRRFGRGRHPAGLSYGDLFAYALATATGEPLLYKGDDFARTDVTPC